jgi:hypothetical protein
MGLRIGILVYPRQRAIKENKKRSTKQTIYFNLERRIRIKNMTLGR